MMPPLLLMIRLPPPLLLKEPHVVGLSTRKAAFAPELLDLVATARAVTAYDVCPRTRPKTASTGLLMTTSILPVSPW